MEGKDILEGDRAGTLATNNSKLDVDVLDLLMQEEDLKVKLPALNLEDGRCEKGKVVCFGDSRGIARWTELCTSLKRHRATVAMVLPQIDGQALNAHDTGATNTIANVYLKQLDRLRSRPLAQQLRLKELVENALCSGSPLNLECMNSDRKPQFQAATISAWELRCPMVICDRTGLCWNNVASCYARM